METTVQTRSGVVFVASHINVDGDLPVQVIDNHIFRCARDAEIEVIDRLLPTGPNFILPYKSPSPLVGETVDSLPRDEWKYWVVAFEESNDKLQELQLACILLNPDIEFGPQIYFTEPDQQGEVFGYSLMPLHLLEEFEFPAVIHKEPRSITADELQNIGALYKGICSLTEQHEYIKHALNNFVSIRRVPSNSDILVVGYFSIIESLITHAPRLAETLDSINHQIRNKMILLRKRYQRDIPYATYFLDAGEDTIWKKLYGYRSCMAHGNIPDFTKEFNILKERSSVATFLKESIKELILVALKEPEFISDLRNC